MGKSGKEDLFRKFKDSFDNMEGHFHVLDHRVPVEVQLAYFRYSEKLRKEKPLAYPVSDETCEELYKTLLTTDGGNSVKRRLLALLAISRSVRAYRLLVDRVSFSDLTLTVGSATIAYGSFVEAVLNFVIMAFAVFCIVKAFNRLHRKKEETPAPAPKPSQEELLLTEIRDLLKEGK